MSELLNVYDPYSELNHEYYFTQSFNKLASCIALRVPMEQTKENYEKVMKALNFTEEEFTLVVKNWTMEDDRDATDEEDFPYQLLFKSNTKTMIVWVALQSDELKVHFFIDCQDAALEKEVIIRHDKLRKQFGLKRTPTFNVLTKCGSNFSTEEVRTDRVKIDIESNYNSDFREVYELIDKSIPAKASGLILLYGKPGTGKTTYIKSLISKHKDANFIFIQNEFVSNLLDPSFISFLLQQRNAILVIEDAEKVITSRENQRQESVVSTILQLTDGLFSDYLNIKVICTFNTDLSKIDTALLRKGRLIAMYEFNPLSIDKTNQLLRKLGTRSTGIGMSVADIYNFDEKSFDNLKKKAIGFAV